MRLFRLLAAALLLLPAPGTALAAARVVEAPQKGAVVAPSQLPTLPKLSVVDGLTPNFTVPVAALTAVPYAKPTAVQQATAVLPDAQSRPEQQAVRLQAQGLKYFDGSNAAVAPEDSAVNHGFSANAPSGLTPSTPAPRVLGLLPPLKSKNFHAPWTKTKIKISGGLGWALLVPAGISVLAAAAFLGFPVVAAAGVIAFVVASPLRPKDGPEPPLALSAEHQTALTANAQALVDGLVARMGLPKGVAPKVRLTNDSGAENAWAMGLLDGKGEIGVGVGMAARGDRELAGVLAHELGHLYHKDSENHYTHAEDAGRAAGFVTLWSVLATTGGLLLGSEAGVSIAGIIAAGAGGTVAAFGSALVAKASRFMERRADRFGAWLTAPGWMAVHFKRDAKNDQGMSDPFSTHPKSWKRLRDMRRLGWQQGGEVTGQAGGAVALPESRPIGDWKKRERSLGLWALEKIVPALILAGPVAAFAAFGFWLGLLSLAGTFGATFLLALRQLGPEKKDVVKLGDYERLQLQRRARVILDGLFASLGVAPQKRPRIVVTNKHGADNAWVNGGLDDMTIGLGEKWFERGDRQLAVVLAHELGHVFNKDSRALGAKLSGLLSKGQLAGALLGLLGAVLAAALGAGMSSLIWAPAALGAPVALYFAGKASSRLRERRADRFAAWLTNGRWLAEFFRTLRPRPEKWTSTHPAPASRIEFGLLAEVKRLRKSLGRTPTFGGPKGPGDMESSSLK